MARIDANNARVCACAPRTVQGLPDFQSGYPGVWILIAVGSFQGRFLQACGLMLGVGESFVAKLLMNSIEEATGSSDKK